MIIRRNVLEKIAANLREFGYPDVTADLVADQLVKDEDQRDVIGMFAADMLRENGILSWTVEREGKS